jgi:hypothetical protein
MAQSPGLDDFGAIYPGFIEQREELKAYVEQHLQGVATADGVFELAVGELRGTDKYVGKTNEEVAREAMRVLLKWMRDQGRK